MEHLVFLGEFGVGNNMDTSLWTSRKRALSAVSARDAQGWFISCRYKSFQS